MIKGDEHSTVGNQLAANSTCEIPHHFIDKLLFNVNPQQMDTLQEIILNTPETDEARIQLIKEELAAGTYQIQSQDIAAKLTERTLQAVEQPEMA